MKLFTPLVLPNDAVIPNHLAKAATEENMVDADHAPSDALLCLYEAWVTGGAGLILTGNVMIDHRAVTSPNGAVLEDGAHLKRFRRWAQVAHAHDAHAWVQINHPGRQMPALLGQPTLAPSAVPLALDALSEQFPVPRETTEVDIGEVQQRFTRSAQLAEQSGFIDVQIHTAYGYLLSQFLPPISNQRQDQWGGSTENRARLLLDIVRNVRAAVSPQFAVAVKLNSADFQRGGFSPDNAKQVVELLNPLGVDLVELSGGSYEMPTMRGHTRDGRTLAREAYFLEFARDIAAVARMSLMITGGIRYRAVAGQVVNNGVDMVGIATTLSIGPNLPRDWVGGKNNAPALQPVTWRNKTLGALANVAVVKFQLSRLSERRTTDPRVSPLRALIQQQLTTACQSWRYRRWAAQRQAR